MQDDIRGTGGVFGRHRDSPGLADGSQLLETTSELPVLTALLRIADAVSRAVFFDEVLEVIAQQALTALDAASLSISRWEPSDGVLRTLINVGDLAPQEQRWPRDECYYVGTDPNFTELLAHGHSYTNAIDDKDCPPNGLAMLRDLGKESALAVPVMRGNTMWGEIWAAGTAGRRFDHGDAQLLQAIAAIAAAAIGRSELLSTVWTYAYQDPLTGIANRRAIDQRFDGIDWDRSTLVALMCDLDGFKHFNDQAGHPAGDELLRGVAQALQRQAETVPGAFAARLGGDEFCILLPDATLDSAQSMADDATREMRSMLKSVVSVCWGAASTGPDIRGGQDLLAAADAALLEAKRQGPARFSTTAYTRAVQGGLDRRGLPSDAFRGSDGLAAAVVRILQEDAPQSGIDALEILAMQVQQAIGSAAWAISVLSDDGLSVYTPRKVDTVMKPDSGLTVLTDLGLYGVQLADYPATARAMADATTFIAAIGLEGSDQAETALLVRLGYRAVLGVGAHSAKYRYLLEIHSRDGHRGLADLAALVQVLSAYCVSKTSVV